MDAFNARFPGATAKWETEVGNTLKAEFLQDGWNLKKPAVPMFISVLPKTVK